MQMFGTLTVFYSGIGIGCLVWNAARLIESHINKLKEMIHLVFEEPDPVIKSRKLKQWIRYHNIILRMGAQLAHLNMNTQGHYYGIIGISCIASMENYLMQDKMVSSFMQLIGYAMMGFIVGHSGQILTDGISSIGDAVYTSNWYLSEPKMMRDVKFILSRCQKPIVLNAFLYGTFNYSTFVLGMKTSFSYYTILRQNIQEG
ncbi:hypothetical protein JTB14_014027 [Gonioctena quinquepunctata]|nr:hypothetical protein JTB14_014027 [Gonioctena quinquepunctata]